MAIIIGRKKEQAIFDKVLESKEASFLAIYGRRRIGKTYLVSNYFKDKGLFFHMTGIFQWTFDTQLQRFIAEFSDHFSKGKEVEKPADWFTAFQMLRIELEKIPQTTKNYTLF